MRRQHSFQRSFQLTCYCYHGFHPFSFLNKHIGQYCENLCYCTSLLAHLATFSVLCCTSQVAHSIRCLKNITQAEGLLLPFPDLAIPGFSSSYPNPGTLVSPTRNPGVGSCFLSHSVPSSCVLPPRGRHGCGRRVFESTCPLMPRAVFSN